MAELIGTLTTVIGIAAKLREVAKKVHDADTKNLIADLNLQLADLKMQIADLQQENLSLRAAIGEARQHLDIRSKLEVRDKVHFLTESGPGRPPGPYCPRCFDADEKLILVTELGPEFQVFGRYRCNNCKGTY